MRAQPRPLSPGDGTDTVPTPPPRSGPVEDFQYCVLCDAVVLFEEVQATDHPADDPAGEWICVDCGSALLVGAPPQTLDRTA